MKLTQLLVVGALTTGVAGTATAQQKPASEPAPTKKELAQKRPAQKTPIDAAANPHAQVLADFNARTQKYVELQKQLARGIAAPKKTDDPAEINARQDALAAKVRAARADAKQGDFFTPQVTPVFRRLLAPQLKGEDGEDTKDVLKDDAPAPSEISFKVNAKYPDGKPLPSVPANLLLNLPTLPAPLEYRIIGKHLILLDTQADIIVDYIPNAIR